MRWTPLRPAADRCFAGVAHDGPPVAESNFWPNDMPKVRGAIGIATSCHGRCPGSVSTQMFLASLRDALADDSVGSIVVDIDSPGGSVYQIQEVGDEIYKARSQKPIYGITNCLAASAAYWLGTQCTHLYCSPSGEVGSIGVLAVHEDWSKANEMAGVKPTYIAAGPYKTEMNADEPLSDEARAYQQSRIDDYYSMFVKAVARGRNASVADVRSKMGGGRVLGADDAFAVNMTCGTYSFDEVIKKARAAAKSPKGASALAVPQTSALAAISTEALRTEFASLEALPETPARLLRWLDIKEELSANCSTGLAARRNPVSDHSVSVS